MVFGQGPAHKTHEKCNGRLWLYHCYVSLVTARLLWITLEDMMLLKNLQIKAESPFWHCAVQCACSDRSDLRRSSSGHKYTYLATWFLARTQERRSPKKSRRCCNEVGRSSLVIIPNSIQILVSSTKFSKLQNTSRRPWLPGWNRFEQLQPFYRWSSAQNHSFSSVLQNPTWWWLLRCRMDQWEF